MKKIIIKFPYISLKSCKCNLGSERFFNIEFKNDLGITSSLMKYSECSSVERRIEDELKEILNEKFDERVNFETDTIFLNYFDVDGKIKEVLPLLVVNGLCEFICIDKNSINIECHIDKFEFNMQIICLRSDKNKEELATISFDSVEDEKIIIFQ